MKPNEQHNYQDTILAKDKYLSLDTWETHLNNNVMLVGATGRGKTRHFLKPNIMQLNSSYVISDPKGVLIYELGTLLEEEGYKIKVLNLVDMVHSNTYNPFNYFKNDSDIYKFIDYLIANINPVGYGHMDPFWDNSAKALLAALCFYLRYECNPEDRNLASVMKLLRCGGASDYDEKYESTLDIMFRTLQERDPDHIAAQQYAVFKAGAGKTRQSILISTAVYLQYFNLDEYRNLTSTDNIDLRALSREKTALFVIISDTDRSKNWLAGLFYSQLFDVLCSQENQQHIRFILDDFVCAGRIPDFDYKLAMIRSRNLSAIVVVQDEAQLVKEYDTAAQGIITNCDTYVFLGASNIDICETVAKRHGHPLVVGDTIRRMKYNDCVVICGNETLIVPKYNITDHPNYPLVADHPEDPRWYPLEKNHIAEPVQKPRATTQNYHRTNKGISLKDGIFDSFEEEYLYSVMKQITNLRVYPHVQLRDVFCSTDTAYSKKLSMMHCDFIIRNAHDQLLFGVEIDGSQHATDLHQIANDQIKDFFFESQNIPLLRFKAKDVRELPRYVIDNVVHQANFLEGTEHIFDGDIPDYFRELRKKDMQRFHRYYEPKTEPEHDDKVFHTWLKPKAEDQENAE